MAGVARIIFERRNQRDVSVSGDAIAAEIRGLLHDFASPIAGDVSVEYRPAVDVIETEAAIEIVADLPGAISDELRVVFKSGLVIIAGRKRPPVCQHAATFHLAERTFGRFAVGIRITVAVDLGRARAALRQGELHITLPRIAERRRGEIQIPIERA
jgi:HSP20 family protein